MMRYGFVVILIVFIFAFVGFLHYCSVEVLVLLYLSEIGDIASIKVKISSRLFLVIQPNNGNMGLS